MRLASLLILALVCGEAAAQCPDGTPMPCATRAAIRTLPTGVAVLYFDNASRDTAYAYLADGLTESIIDRLGQSGVPVTSRYVVRRLRETKASSPSELAEQLHMSHVLSGSLRGAGSSLRVSVELIRLPGGDRVWGGQFDRPNSDVLGVETEIATMVADSVLGRLRPQQRRKLSKAVTTNSAAYDHYQRGQFLLAQRTGATIMQSIREFSEAVRIDVKSPRLQGALAQAYSICLAWADCSIPTDTLQRRGLAAVDAALRIDSNTVSAWTARATLLRQQVANDTTRDLTRSWRSIERAIALDSMSSDAWHARGLIAVFVGCLDMAEASYRRALVIEPGRAITYEQLSRIALFRGDFALAERLVDSAQVSEPLFNPLALVDRVVRARAARGDASGARKALEQSHLKDEFLEAVVLAVEGDTAKALAAVRASRSSGTNFGEASILALVGDRSRALDVLEKIARPDLRTLYRLRFPEFNSLRNEPRFQRIWKASLPRVPIS